MKKNINKNTKQKIKINWGLLTLAIPGLAFLIAFYYVPLFGLIIPFKQIDYAKGILGSDWAGFKNFEFLFKSSDAWRITRNTVCLNALFITVTFLSAVILAILMYNLSRRMVKLYQTLMFIPYFVSWIVAGYVVYAFLGADLGAITNFMESIGIVPPRFYFEAKWWPMILTIAFVWKNVGYYTLLFYATLISIDTSYLEAAAIDGASKLQRVRYILLPHMKPTIITLLILQIGKIFNSDFGMYYFLTKNSGALYETTDVIDTYVFRSLRVTGNIGISSAAALYQSLVGLTLVLITNWVVRKYEKDNAIF